MCRDSALGLCLIYFVDGKEKKAVKKALRLFKRSTESKPLHYLWVNASCHPEYGDVFGISPQNLPVLLFAKPKQRLFKTLDGRHGSLSKGKKVASPGQTKEKKKEAKKTSNKAKDKREKKTQRGDEL
ncbi:hypothetical protein OS493_008754 [Desmophyllum pertusum]|uniref:Uncharacterized protein n=1 Tax=Desmophyllum pertusum TaxID=174260 RepID=A0A9X0D4W3_9CNID|nr:hypothetical protein OS493_008754 [Desmophyllum pertusum]